MAESSNLYRKMLVARLVALTVLMAWSVGLAYFLIFLVVGLLITPYELGALIVMVSLIYVSVFAIFVVPSALIYRHLNALASAFKAQHNVQLAKQMSSYQWVLIDIIFSCLLPAGLLIWVKPPIPLLDRLIGGPIPYSLIELIHYIMLILGSGFAVIEAILLRSLGKLLKTFSGGNYIFNRAFYG
ncbi:MAG: hypothetical protein ACP5T2_06600 [Thermoprotei archaeon]